MATNHFTGSGLAELAVYAVRILSQYALYEHVDIARGFGTRVHLMGMFVHAHRQDRRATR